MLHQEAQQVLQRVGFSGVAEDTDYAIHGAALGGGFEGVEAVPADKAPA